MKLGKDIAFMAMGAGAVLAYQKYSKPMMKAVDNTAKKAIKKANDKLEDMMQIKTLYGFLLFMFIFLLKYVKIYLELRDMNE